MNGIEKKQLQIDRGTRLLVENVDDLRCKYGFSAIQVQTPIVESRLRSGLVPLRPLIFTYTLPSRSTAIQITVPITFPNQGHLSLAFIEGNGAEDVRFDGLKESLIEVIKSATSLSSAMEEVLIAVTNYEKTIDFRQADIVEDKEINRVPSVIRTEDEELVDLQSIRFFTCRSCRYCLADTSQLHEHSASISDPCTSLFFEEAPSFLHIKESDGDEGKLLCPKCEGKVGNWSWIGSKCSCNAWIVPAFQLVKSKVDVKFYAE